MENRHRSADKSEWRKRMAVVRDGLHEDDRERRSAKLCRLLEREALAPLRSRFARPLRLCAYSPFRSEASPVPLLAECWDRGDAVFAPRTLPGNGGMELRRVESLADWMPGRWGVPEPNPHTTRLGEPDEPLDVVLVPGLAFGESGGRLGYGGGYYDRFYAARSETNGNTLWIGFAYEAQVVEGALPAEPHDLSLDALATDERMIWFRKGERA
ncbi:5-formyltetrahydrofolate cyclo-ligase [Paenibacillaceae bacterium WGS1546]|uniref:5-formyltetrahydrofolate cyclo-ligase n=1 Tax=Cohnella sp. WGS1546 TaxID=3366810 RepID=UPI00372D8157